MATKIKIGADELILWLRKNKKAEGISNEVLGKKILNLIVEETKIGKKVESSEQSLWDNDDEKSKLPKHAAQYEIDLSKIEELYDELNKWEKL